MLLITVLVTSAIVLSASISVILLGVDQSGMFFSQERGERSIALAHACAALSLEQLKDDFSYTGSTTVNTFDIGTCEYNVIDTGGSTRDINIEGLMMMLLEK